MEYATYIFPKEKKVKEKKQEEEEVENPKSVGASKRKHFGGPPPASDVPLEVKLAVGENHLIELHHKIDRITNENIALQNYLDERPDLQFDTMKQCCLLQNEDLYNWKNMYADLVKKYADIPAIIEKKQDDLGALHEKFDYIMLNYKNLEERENLTKELKVRAVICNKQLSEYEKNIKLTQDKLSWMEDYHKIQLNGEVAVLRREQEKEKFAINHFKKLCEKFEEEIIASKSDHKK